MILIRKWNPESAMFINNTNGGPKVYRILALIKEGVFDHYVCFYDSWTQKVYVESARMKHGSSYFDHSSIWQIHNDKEWKDVIDFLSNDECQVIQMVENSYKTDKDTGNFQIHENMFKLPKTKFGVDSNGAQSITGASPLDMQVSPSLTDSSGNLLTTDNKGREIKYR